MTTDNNEYGREMIRLVAAIVTAIGMVILIPLMSWSLLAIVSLGERTTSLETWRGEGRRYTSVDATKDFGVVLRLIEANTEAIEENSHSIRNIQGMRQ